jgi:tRNA nucleotidyltransferase (CCA-adding enzyme)
MEYPQTALLTTFKTHPHFSTVSQVYHKILAAGHQVFLAGGCVRDGILGTVPKDFDLATSATPDQVIALFAKTVEVGKAFGVVVVVENGLPVEVTTFRTDGPYQDGRRPTSITFSSAEEDAQRRDFTVNALFYDIQSEQLMDYVGGLVDLKNKILRAVGDPGLRFQEDSLRMLRAVRFVGQLGFSIEDKTREAILSGADRVTLVSAERIHAELEKLLISPFRTQALAEFTQTSLAKKLFPKSSLHFDSWWKNVSDLTVVSAWVLFWNTYADGLVSPGEDGEKQVFSALESLRFSSVQKASIKKALHFRFHPEDFREKSVGELIELCFDFEQESALQAYVTKGLLDAQKWTQVQSIKSRWMEGRPAPIIRAQDLSSWLPPGPSLGLALRVCYWAQLEGRVQTLPEAINFLKLQKILH